MSPGTAEPAKTVNFLLQLVGVADIAADPAAGAAFSAALGQAAAATPLAIDLRDGADAAGPAQTAIVLERSVSEEIADPFALIVPLQVLQAATPTNAPTPTGLPELSKATPPTIPQTIDPARRQPMTRRPETPGAPPAAHPTAAAQADDAPSRRPPAWVAAADSPAPDIAPVAPQSEAANSNAPAREIPPPPKAVAIVSTGAAPEQPASPDAGPSAPPASFDVVAAPPIAARHDLIVKTAPPAPEIAPRPVSIVTSSVARDGTIEVRLDPPELGRVAIDFTADANGAVRAVIIIDRAETLDLVRRHIDIFKDELAKHGFGDVDMSFRERGRDGDDSPPPAPPPKKWNHLVEAGFDLDAAMTNAAATGQFDVVA